MENKDIRMKNCSEVLGSLLTIKFNGWEEKFREKILCSREIELVYLWRVKVIASINTFLFWSASNLVSVATIAVYVRELHRDLTAAKIFTALSLFRLLQVPLRELPRYVTQLYQSISSLERLATMFLMEEKQQPPTRHPHFSSLSSVQITNCTFHWSTAPTVTPIDTQETEVLNPLLGAIPQETDPDLPTFTLHLPELTIRSGEFVVVRGIIGQGKSSLCQALLREMPLAENISSSSILHVNENLVYASQIPWIQNTTLRQNIIYNLPYDQEKYFRVLHACCLLEDLRQFPFGDLTFIGQRGVNLSGGQKCRIALARALFSDREIFLLDDIFAALDSIVGKQVFDRALCGLLQRKTRILVTHQDEIIDHSLVNQVLSLRNGVVGIESQRQMQSVRSPLYSSTSIMADDYEIPSDDYQLLLHLTTASIPTAYVPPGPSDNDHRGDEEEETAEPPSNLKKNELQSIEDKESGSVSGAVYLKYARAAGGYRVVGTLILVQLIWQLLGIASDVFLANWSREDSEEQKENLSKNLAIYAALAIGSGCVVLLRILTVSYYGYHAGRNLFVSMLTSLLNAPMWWFDQNPSGRCVVILTSLSLSPVCVCVIRIYNRVGEDQNCVDGQVPVAIGNLFAMVFSLGGSIITVLVITRSLGLVLLPIAWAYYWYLTHFLAGIREIQRFESISKSPLLSDLSECMEGLSVIRSYGPNSMAHIISNHETSLNTFLQVASATNFATSWFTLRTQLLGSFFIFSITLILFVGYRHDFVSVEMIALALSYTLSIGDDFMSFVIDWSWCERTMISSERILQYINIQGEGEESNRRLFQDDCPFDEQERQSHQLHSKDSSLLSANLTTPLNVSPPLTPLFVDGLAQWPTDGIIEFKHVDYKHQPKSKEYVLTDVTFRTSRHEKIGIVGRSGAGKSSLAMSLFRIAELSHGTIQIDGVDISTLTLSTLRNAINIIPQSPILFKGSLRSYLDPFQEYSDEKIWIILEKTRVSELLQQMTSSSSSSKVTTAMTITPQEISTYLNFEIAENGENLSLGERQLFVLSRALLRDTRLLIIDEATASMDRQTDQQIQQIMRKEFQSATVLTIAHRIETIIDCDRVLVLSAGTESTPNFIFDDFRSRD
jgi:ABC-type multidrug transport system fused ATPase/permease subunit